MVGRQILDLSIYVRIVVSEQASVLDKKWQRLLRYDHEYGHVEYLTPQKIG